MDISDDVNINRARRPDLWYGLDRLKFCENAILLQLRNQSQGPIVTSHVGKKATDKLDETAARLVNAFLDDVALLASGPGGSDYVAATCLEGSFDESVLTVRVARNEGFGSEACIGLQKLIDLAYDLQASEEKSCDEIHLDAPNDKILHNVVSTCSGRVRKHTSALQGELRHARCRVIKNCKIPPYKAGCHVTESREDTARLGLYGSHNHGVYLNLVQERMNSLRAMCSTIGNGSRTDPANFCRIVRTAYTLRHSSLLWYWLQENLCLNTKPAAMPFFIDGIIKRIGKLSRFYRARLNIARVVRHLARRRIRLKVIGLSTQKIQVPELQHRTAANLRARAGPLLKSCSDGELRSLLGRWSRYRVHAEMQLLMYYERHEDVSLVTNYIGGDKLCCYLCHQFITTHGRFTVNGCHQSLYSLWMVPQEVAGCSAAAMNRLHHTLASLCILLQQQVSTICQSSGYKNRYHTQRESCDNLSRLSILTDLSVGRHLLPTSHHDKLRSNMTSLAEIVEAGTCPGVDEISTAVASTEGFVKCEQSASRDTFVDEVPRGLTSEHVSEHLSEHFAEHSGEDVFEHAVGHSSEHSTENPSEHPSECSTEHPSEYASEHVSEHAIERVFEHAVGYSFEHSIEHPCEHLSENISEHSSEHLSENMSEHLSENMSEHLSETPSEHPSEDLPENISEFPPTSEAEPDVTDLETPAICAQGSLQEDSKPQAMHIEHARVLDHGRDDGSVLARVPRSERDPRRRRRRRRHHRRHRHHHRPSSQAQKSRDPQTHRHDSNSMGRRIRKHLRKYLGRFLCF